MPLVGPISDYSYIANNGTSNEGIVMGGAAAINFNVGANGGIIMGGSAFVCRKSCVTCRFAPGSMVFLISEAVKGILNKIIIKETKLQSIPRDCASIGAGGVCIYFDTFNAVYADDELTDQATALDLAQQYYEAKIAANQAVLSGGIHALVPPFFPVLPSPGPPPEIPIIPAPPIPVPPVPVPPVPPPPPTPFLIVSELDGNPFVEDVSQIIFNGTTEVVTNLGDGVVLINSPTSPPNVLGGSLLLLGTTLYLGRTSQGNINYETFAGDSHNYLTNDVVGISLTLSSFGLASQGTLVLRLNGENIATIELESNFVEADRVIGQNMANYNTGTGLSGGVAAFQGSVAGKGNMTLVFVQPFGGVSTDQYQEGQIVINITDPTFWRQGYNSVVLSQTGCDACPLSTDTFKIFNDIDTGLNPSVSLADLDIGTSNIKHLSGIRYLTSGSTLLLDFQGNDLFNDVYHNSEAPVTYNASDWGISTTALLFSDSSVSGVTTPPTIGDTMTVTDLSITIPVDQEKGDARITIIPRDPYGSYGSVMTPSNDIMIMSYGNESTSLAEFFRDEQYRIPLDTDFDIVPSNPVSVGAWDSTISLAAGTTGYTTALQVFDPDGSVLNSLIHPETDYTGRLPSGSPDYTSLASGTSFQYVRIFQDQTKTDRFNGIISVPGITNAELGTDVKIFIKVPDGTVWLDATKNFVLGTFSTNAPVGNTDFTEGCRINPGVNSPDINGRLEFSLGTIGTDASNGHSIYIMIEYADQNVVNVLNGSGNGFSIVNWN